MLPLRGPPQRKALHVGASGGVGTLAPFICAEFSLRIHLNLEPVIGSLTRCPGVIEGVLLRTQRESSDACDHAALFLCGHQAMPFLKNDDRVPMWQAQYKLIMDILMAEDKLRIADRQAIANDS